MTTQVRFDAGMHITTAAEKLVTAALEHGEAEGSFNDIPLRARRGMSADAVVRAFEEQSNARSEAYRNSPAGKAAERARQERVAEMQAEHDRLLADLATLDFGSDVAVLDWLCAMQEPSDHVGVKVAKDEILSAFRAAGFEPNVNAGDAYNGEDRDNAFRYLVGQALDGLERVAIHGILLKFAAEWRRKFILQ
jgi:hypothetical protein